MPKRTKKPSKSKRARRHGFLERSSSPSGKKILKNRRQKGRSTLSV